MKLDYTLKTPEERIAYIESILPTLPEQEKSKQYLSYMSDYILFVADKNQTKKERSAEHPISTKNREITINKRQVSFEELVASLENGEDGLYAFINNDKNQLLDPKDPISEEDKETIPGLSDYLALIQSLQKQFDQATGMAKYSLKKQIIETWQQIYILKASFKNAPARGKMPNQVKNMAHMSLEENVILDDNDLPQSDAIISLFNPAHISFLLCYYSQLKQECGDDLQSDMHFLLLDLEDLAERTLSTSYPELWDLLIWKVDGYTNDEIQKMIAASYGITHNEQYYSTLWRKKIPKLLAEQAQKDYLIWYYTNQEYGTWKKCGKCGQIKLAHPLFFSRNTSKDHFYSICKECRRKK